MTTTIKDLADGEETTMQGSGKKPYTLKNVGVTYEGGLRDLADGETVFVEPDDDDPCPTDDFYMAPDIGDTPGIYAITNVITGSWYVGSSIHVRNRLRDHRYRLRAGRHENKHLQRAWTLYGENAFKGFLLETCEENSLLKREQHYIDLDSHYNMAKVAGSTRGMRHPKRGPMSEEQRRRIGDANRGRRHSDEARARMSAVRKGVPKSEEFKRNLSRRMKGRTITQEHRRALSDALRGKRSKAAELMAAKTHCPKDHPYSPENTLLNPRGHRTCRECKSLRDRARYQRNRGN